MWLFEEMVPLYGREKQLNECEKCMGILFTILIICFGVRNILAEINIRVELEEVCFENWVYYLLFCLIILAFLHLFLLFTRFVCFFVGIWYRYRYGRYAYAVSV